jgi:SAM-dependent methyltransferase
MTKPIVGAEHQFHDAAFVAGWADRFAPTPERMALFERMHAELAAALPPDATLVELGVGPGYLAEYLLDALPQVRYWGVDFSRPMLELAGSRLRAHGPRLGLLRADLLTDAWWRGVPAPIDAVVTTWSLHDLGSQANVEAVYRSCARELRSGGILLNGDFIKPGGTAHQFEAGRLEIERHLELLREAGFARAECLLVLEREIEAPTAAQNYACFKAVR